jgi:hypothetical protein
LLFRLYGWSTRIQGCICFCTGDGGLYGNADDNGTKQGFGEFHVSFFKVGFIPDKGTDGNVA